MADIKPTIIEPHGPVTTITWSEVDAGDECLPARMYLQAALAACVQTTGTFGGATIGFEASNDGANWVDMSDLQGELIAFNASGMAEFTSSAMYLRPSIIGGGGADITMTLVARG